MELLKFKYMTQEELSIIFDTHKEMFDFFENNVITPIPPTSAIF